MTYLLLRLSSLGNVAMTVPVVASLSRRYPNDRFVVVAKKPLAAMFYGMDNVVYHEANFRTGGLGSVLALFHELRAYHVDAVIDLQDVLRTRLLRLFFRLHGVKTYTVHYGRAQKRALTLTGHKGVDPLPTEFSRYQDVLREAGLQTDNDFACLPINEEARQQVKERFGEPQAEEQWIGIAPFAKSKSNMLPYHLTKELIQYYSRQTGTRVYLFGAGVIECEMLRQWASIFPNVVSVAGLLPLEQELELMRNLRVMICMDSANQHLSSLVGLRAVSIWCGTHHKMGFYGWKQDPADRLEIDDLACRPCSVHGTNKCKNHHYACRQIPAQRIIDKVNEKK